MTPDQINTVNDEIAEQDTATRGEGTTTDGGVLAAALANATDAASQPAASPVPQPAAPNPGTVGGTLGSSTRTT